MRAFQVAPKTYFGVRIDGCSRPQGAKIWAERGVRSSVGGQRAETTLTEGRRAVSSRRKLSGVLTIRADKDPDFAAGFGLVKEDPFVDLGPEREYETLRGRRGDSCRRRFRRVGGNENPTEYSTSEPRFTGDGIGQARIESPTVLESHGVLLDMWNALQFLRDECPERIRSVEWYTPATGFGTDSPPRLMGLPSGGGATADAARRSWRLFDPAAEPTEIRPRGVAVLRVAIDHRWICIVEIERRPAQRREECFSGLVVRG